MLGRADRDVTRFARGMRKSRSVAARLTGVRPGVPTDRTEPARPLIRMPCTESYGGAMPCRFEQAHLPPLPDGRFDVVLLLEAMLAFPDKAALVAEVARVLEPGGRFAFTLEEGPALGGDETARMPDADTVWLIELAE